MKKTIHDGSLLWLGLVLLIALCIAFLLPVAPEDFWWYMRVGKETLASGAIPSTDSFTYSIFGQAIYYHSWGASVLFYLLYKLNGLNCIVFLRGLIVALTYTTVWLVARKQNSARISSSLVLLAAILASCNNWSIRPQLLVYPLFAFSLWILYEWREGNKKIIWWLPVIALIWGNLHASFVILVVLVLAAVIFGKGDRRRLLIVFAVLLGALCLNPRGWHTWEYVVQLLISPSNQQFSLEWGPPVNKGWQMNLFFFWILLFPVLVVFSPKKMSTLEWVWFLGFGFMALWGLRYGIWFILVLAIFTAKLLSTWEEKYLPASKRSVPVLNLVFPILFAASSLAFLPDIRQIWWKQAPEVTTNTPIKAVDWLRAHPDLEGPLVSEMGFASYLEFMMPERPVWIDSRVFPFPTDMWEDYRNFSLGYWNWDQSLENTHANLLMVSEESQPKLALALAKSADWCNVYSDDVAQIYTRGGCNP